MFSSALPLLAAVFGAVAAVASPLQERQTYDPCSGLAGTAQCCAVDVLGVADLDCTGPPTTPTDAADFQAICAAFGDKARCCVLPILDQDLVCETPAGVTD